MANGKADGYKTYHTARIWKSYGYFSNTDEERAAGINKMFASKKIDAILHNRGVYGCTRIMQMLDYEAIKSIPKILIGFSDVTVLWNGIHQKTGLICFHGPVGSTLNDGYSKKGFKAILENVKPSK